MNIQHTFDVERVHVGLVFSIVEIFENAFEHCL
jgi:hypothetical protein